MPNNPVLLAKHLRPSCRTCCRVAAVAHDASSILYRFPSIQRRNAYQRSAVASGLLPKLRAKCVVKSGVQSCSYYWKVCMALLN